MESILQEIYIDNNYPAIDKLFLLAKRRIPDLTKANVKDFLELKDSYQILKEQKYIKRSAGHIVSHYLFQTLQIDIFDLSKFGKNNKGFNYMFACVDVFSRYAFIVPMKTKNIQDTTRAMMIILNEIQPATPIAESDITYGLDPKAPGNFLSTEIQNKLTKKQRADENLTVKQKKDRIVSQVNPNDDIVPTEEEISNHPVAFIMSDNDASFTGSEFQKVLNAHVITLETNAIGDHNALGIIDSFARRIKRILTAQFLEFKRNRWIDNIQDILTTYNQTPHSSLGDFSPNSVANDDPDITAYIYILNELKGQKNGVISDLKVGDLVRLNIQTDFSKGTDPRWSDKVYIVKLPQGNTIVLDNDKKYIRKNLLLVPVGSKSSEKKNNIQKAKTDFKTQSYLKSHGHIEKVLPSRTRRAKLDSAVKH